MVQLARLILTRPIHFVNAIRYDLYHGKLAGELFNINKPWLDGKYKFTWESYIKVLKETTLIGERVPNRLELNPI